MDVGTASAEALLDRALTALDDEHWRDALDAIAAPVYRTDADGNVTYWNRACVDFAGREPELERDRWCVTWKLHTTAGDPLPHDRCPMAVAIREARAVRQTIAIAERPDGSRVAFAPYPTPLFDAGGGLTGAINLLIDVSAAQAVELRQQAERCRRLARGVDDKPTIEILAAMADRYDSTAASLAR